MSNKRRSSCAACSWSKRYLYGHAQAAIVCACPPTKSRWVRNGFVAKAAAVRERKLRTSAGRNWGLVCFSCRSLKCLTGSRVCRSVREFDFDVHRRIGTVNISAPLNIWDRFTLSLTLLKQSTQDVAHLFASELIGIIIIKDITRLQFPLLNQG